MFERFTEAARRVVVRAQEEARSLGQQEILAEHLLLSILAETDSISAGVLRELGVQRARLVAELSALSTGDDAALQAIGIDLAAVRDRAEAAFGPGALDRPRRRRPRGLLHRVVGTAGHLPFTQPAKRALEQSLRQALALQHRAIGVDHLLLGLLADDHDPAARVLQRTGVSVAEVRAEVRSRLQQAA
jgi:ATP-dependent Clp protease ATP-binding subunit ClpA